MDENLLDDLSIDVDWDFIYHWGVYGKLSIVRWKEIRPLVDAWKSGVSLVGRKIDREIVNKMTD